MCLLQAIKFTADKYLSIRPASSPIVHFFAKNEINIGGLSFACKQKNTYKNRKRLLARIIIETQSIIPGSIINRISLL